MKQSNKLNLGVEQLDDRILPSITNGSAAGLSWTYNNVTHALNVQATASEQITMSKLANGDIGLNGADTGAAAASNLKATVNFGSYSDFFLDNTTAGSYQNLSVKGGDGYNDVVWTNMWGGRTQVNLGNGNADGVRVGSSNATVIMGNGNGDYVNLLGGSNDQVILGTGSDYIYFSKLDPSNSVYHDSSINAATYEYFPAYNTAVGSQDGALTDYLATNTSYDPSADHAAAVYTGDGIRAIYDWLS